MQVDLVLIYGSGMRYPVGPWDSQRNAAAHFVRLMENKDPYCSLEAFEVLPWDEQLTWHQRCERADEVATLALAPPAREGEAG